MTEQDIIDALSGGLLYIVAALFVIIVIFKGVRIVPQSEKYVVERFGRLKSVLGPGINFIVPFLDVVRHKVSILERQLPNASQDAITRDNVLVEIDTSVFYRILEPEKNRLPYPRCGWGDFHHRGRDRACRDRQDGPRRGAVQPLAADW